MRKKKKQTTKPKKKRTKLQKAAAAAPIASRSWRDTLSIHPAAELFPLMSADELRDLAQDIKDNGLKHPVIIFHDEDDNPSLLDGRNRLDALEILGDDDRFNLENSSYFELRWRDIDPHAYVISANIRRRHLNALQKRELIAKLLKVTPEKSDRQIAEMAKASPTTVGKVRAGMEPTVQPGQLPKRVGKDGKARKKPAAPKTKATAPAAKTATASAAIAENSTTDETSVANEAPAEITPTASSAAAASAEREILAVDIERVATRLVRDDAEGARILHELIAWDNYRALAALAAALARGLGIEGA